MYSSDILPTSEIDAWVEAQKKAKQPHSEEQLNAFRIFLESAATDLSQIATRIAKPYIKPWNQTPILSLWDAIADAVDKFPSQNDKLVELVI